MTTPLQTNMPTVISLYGTGYSCRTREYDEAQLYEALVAGLEEATVMGRKPDELHMSPMLYSAMLEAVNNSRSPESEILAQITGFGGVKVIQNQTLPPREFVYIAKDHPGATYRNLLGILVPVEEAVIN